MISEPTFNRPSLYQSGPSNLFHRGAVYDNAQLKPGTGTFVCMTYIATPLAQIACCRIAIGSSDVTFKMELRCECVLREIQLAATLPGQAYGRELAAPLQLAWLQLESVHLFATGSVKALLGQRPRRGRSRIGPYTHSRPAVG